MARVGWCFSREMREKWFKNKVEVAVRVLGRQALEEAGEPL